MNYVYIVRCSDGTLYTGWTNDLQNRIDTHNAGKGAKYTRGRTPVELVYFCTFDNKKDAMSAEYQIKRLSRAEKLLLIKYFQDGVRKSWLEAIRELIVDRRDNT